MENIITTDITNKVVLDIDKYVELLNENKILKQKQVDNDDKYHNLLKYLFSECEVKKYSSGKKYLNYDGYNNHLTNYLKEIEPDMYEERLSQENKKE